jgi:pimeloyl-ACP methyl ester carboxylesterase
VICASGLTASGAEFFLLAAHLAALGFDVVYPDWPGHCESDWPQDETEYGWEHYVKILGILNRTYGSEKTHFLGVSWGAMVAFFYLLANKASLQSAIFVDLPLTNRPGGLAAYQRLLDQCQASFDTYEEAEDFLHRRRPELSHVPDSLRAYYRAARWAPRDGKIRFRCDPRAVKAVMGRGDPSFDYFPILRRIPCRSLFLYGVESPFRDPDGFAAARRELSHIEYLDDLHGAHPPALLRATDIEPIEAFLTR